MTDPVIQNLQSRGMQTIVVATCPHYVMQGSVVRYPRYLDTYRRYLRDDTSIAKVTIYRGIS